MIFPGVGDAGDRLFNTPGEVVEGKITNGSNGSHEDDSVKKQKLNKGTSI